MSSILLDTNIVIALMNQTQADLPRRLRDVLVDPSATAAISVVSLWEIAIKVALGKLEIRIRPGDVRNWLAECGIPLLPMAIDHALEVAHPEPSTKDPFDRLLLAVCACEGMKLLTTDQRLAEHRLAY
ncbi:MAG: type II toxin-antitoxin system VapC family toxin [Novosphingobium sp.]